MTGAAVREELPFSSPKLTFKKNSKLLLLWRNEASYNELLSKLFVATKEHLNQQGEEGETGARCVICTCILDLFGSRPFAFRDFQTVTGEP